MASYPVYLDYNATTPLDPLVIEEVKKSLNEFWGNPSSSYSLGLKAQSVIESSRDGIAAMINARDEDIVFTSGGTEANNMALRSAVYSAKTGSLKPHVITSNVEHDSVIKVLIDLEKSETIDLSVTEVNKATGHLLPSAVLSLVKETTCLITIMHANNETGMMMPIEQIGQSLKEINIDRARKELPRIYFHTDAAQTLGKVKVDVQELGVDYLTIVGHKFYGPRIGALYVKGIGKETPVGPVVQGGGQERGYRPGTENTPMIAGLGQAAKLVYCYLKTYSETMENCRDYLAKELQGNVKGLSLNFEEGKRLPNTLSVRLPEGTLAATILKKCEGKVFASLGAACHSHTGAASGILISSGLGFSEAHRTIRMSVGRTTTTEEIDLAVKAITAAIMGI